MGKVLRTIVFENRISTGCEDWLCSFAVNILKPSGANPWPKMSPSGSFSGSSTPQLSAHHSCLLQVPVVIIHCALFSLVLHFHSPLAAVGSTHQPHLQGCKTDTGTRHRRDFSRPCSEVLVIIKIWILWSLKKIPVNNICWFPWYKHSHYGQVLAPNVPSLSMKQEWRHQVSFMSLWNQLQGHHQGQAFRDSGCCPLWRCAQGY